MTEFNDYINWKELFKNRLLIQQLFPDTPEKHNLLAKLYHNNQKLTFTYYSCYKVYIEAIAPESPIISKTIQLTFRQLIAVIIALHNKLKHISEILGYDIYKLIKRAGIESQYLIASLFKKLILGIDNEDIIFSHRKKTLSLGKYCELTMSLFINN